MNPNNTSWNSTKSKSSSKSSENSRTTDKKSIKSFHLPQSNSQDFTSDHEISDQKWLDDLVQLRYVKFIPFEEFEDPKIIERGSNGDISSYKSLKWRKMKKRVVVKELKNILNLPENLRESFVRENSRNVMFIQQKLKLTDFGITHSVLFWELSCGRTPFSDHRNPPAQDLANAIIKGLRELPTKDVPIDYLKLYTLCWDMDPEKRPVSETVLMMCKDLINNGDSTKGLEKNVNNRTTNTRKGFEEGTGSK
ncbi:19020_t:CDS:2, partial [Racocetra fulgida]